MKKNVLKKICVVLTILISTSLHSLAQGSVATSNYSTGYEELTGAFINYGTADPHWVVKKPGATTWSPAYVCNYPNGSWAVHPYARWITPSIDGTSPSGNTLTGTYTYSRSFSIDYTTLHSVQFYFSYLGGDNNITGFTVNGHSYTLNPSTANDYNPLTQNVAITINPNHVHAGLNTFTIDVYNVDGFTGLFANLIYIMNVN